MVKPVVAIPPLMAKLYRHHARCAKNQSERKSWWASSYWSFLYKSKWQQVSDKVVSVAQWARHSSVTWVSRVKSQLEGVFFVHCFPIWKKRSITELGRGKVCVWERETILFLSQGGEGLFASFFFSYFFLIAKGVHPAWWQNIAGRPVMGMRFSHQRASVSLNEYHLVLWFERCVVGPFSKSYNEKHGGVHIWFRREAIT